MFVDTTPIIKELIYTNALLNEVLDELRELRAQPPSALSIVPATIPAEGTLIISLPELLSDSDLEQARKELAAHFGGRRVLAFRAGDVKLGYIAFEDDE